jgi:hypothetical protein
MATTASSRDLHWNSNQNQAKTAGGRKKRRWIHSSPENKSSQLPPYPSPVLRNKKNELSSKRQQENTKEEQQSIKDDLTFPHVVLLLWEGEGLSNSYIGEGIGRVERRHRGYTSRNLDKALVEFFSRKTNASNDQN